MQAVAELFAAAVQCHQAGQLDKAKARCEEILAIQPLHADALHLLGTIAHKLGDTDSAIPLIRRAITIGGAPRFHYDLGEILYSRGDYAGAGTSFEAAARLAPNLPRPIASFGNALFQQGEIEAAVAAYRQALAVHWNLPGTHANLGLALTDLGRFDEAIEHCRQAIALNPDLADGHNNLGLALLMRSEFVEGWIHHEWRTLAGPGRGMPRFKRPRWRGAPLNGARILLHAEQGVGDTLQFVRYVPLVAARGGRVVLEVQPALKRLIESVEGAEQIIGAGEPVPDVVEHCPLLSLPLAFGTEISTIPAKVPYLQPTAADVESWRERIAGRPGFRVGLVWGGQPQHRRDRFRSIPLALLAPLAKVDSAVYFSLQKGPPAAQISNSPPGLVLHDIAPDLNDFADTAAAIAALDLVITVDTSVAHVAGALGKPVWILLTHVPDWRWLIGRDDSPWYPSARLFRQPAPGAWTPVIERVAEELSILSKRFQ
jgi:Flp pilus assembly protein TadD